MKYKSVLQHSEEDCGAACLATIAKYYQKIFALNRIREFIGTGKQGTTLLGLKRGAEALGFNTRSVKASPAIVDRLNELPLPAIIHWKGYHYVVLYGQRGKKYVIADPAVGIRYIPKQELLAGWNDGIMLLLEPDPIRFYQQQEDKVSGFARFYKRVAPYRGILFESLLINLFLGVLSLASPFLIQILTDDVLIRGDTQLLRGLAIAIIVMTIVSSTLSLIQANLVTQFAQRLELSLVMEFGRKILRLPLSYYESRRSGEIVSRLQDIQQINQLVAQSVVTLPSQSLIALISLSLMLFYSWKLAIVVLILAVISSMTTLIFLPVMQQKIRSIMVLDAENQGLLVETFKGALTLKTTTAQQQFWEELQSRFSRLARLIYSTAQIGITNNTFSTFISGVGGIVLLWFGSSLVIGRELTIGQLIAFNTMSGNFLNFITGLINFVDKFMRVKTATQRLSEVIDTTAEIDETDNKAYAQIRDDADISLSELVFHHIGRVDLLDDFSLIIPGGKTTAIIGKSGCGKSSLAKLISGLYAYKSGNIRIGAFNLQDLALDCLRQQVVLVPQEAHFWSRSIVENFRLGSPNITFEEIVSACQIAGADEFISKLPDKYQTILGEFGANLSGGQRQRLAIARAIVNNPPVLILDESTAGLDPISEAEVLDRLIAVRQGKTTIMISHRPRVIQRADWIIFLEQGKVKIQGTCEDLENQDGDHINFLKP
ncbi:peptidase domain-containing ABC transporter [Calothrix sp. FACHB-1219]|uniref:peptidase domain-containing ABC transporter n=1 Tax=unclassified Calothrix TaxID=2619626 RepID=UPI00168354EC|nr:MULTISPECIES: peptidase domain-containing ABC transporter [unclassified Calothrix]MBD2202513.1 peptidase domain-containing ABC transporter [Calothrix sp. FACHB-168]MBD2217896.1 peptidase domain-containing ABC transporter [Calothrix sp. FACHB-1219]